VYDQIGYAGASVDNKEVLDGHPWRPNDDTPVETCNGTDPADIIALRCARLGMDARAPPPYSLNRPHPAAICRLTIKHDFGRTEIFV
jgi:hypothetical protein